MNSLAIEILSWIGPADTGSTEDATLASLKITTPEQPPITTVEDSIARTVRTHINVPTYPLSQWLIINWWRLRWEPRHNSALQSTQWLHAHSIAAIGSDYAWPNLQIASDGEFINLHLEPETSFDASAIRYLQSTNIDIPAHRFELAIDNLIASSIERLSDCIPGDKTLTDLHAELTEERADAEVSRRYRLQAIAGIDPGSASPYWLKKAAELTSLTDPKGAQEIMAVVPNLRGGLNKAIQTIEAMRQSPETIQLDWAQHLSFKPFKDEPPWKKGERIAAELRRQLNIAPGPIPTAFFKKHLGAKLPLDRSIWRGDKSFVGGFVDSTQGGRTKVLIPTHREDNQRFYLARLIGSALLASSDQTVLPVSSAITALQKFERAFAQEFLCPWRELDEFTNRHGLDDESIEEASRHFNVSQLLILSTLVNNKKLPMSRLASISGGGDIGPSRSTSVR
ncbi:ImmA/IrrE family metallo-endopeptidase [Corallococcus coralloides]|uniref:ImmA/IrrE family metallo-endopeptidase n=1 Tax=Corallococcus coralloides TaxID=184914 RepID=UPI00384DCD45